MRYVKAYAGLVSAFASGFVADYAGAPPWLTGVCAGIVAACTVAAAPRNAD